MKIRKWHIISSDQAQIIMLLLGILLFASAKVFASPVSLDRFGLDEEALNTRFLLTKNDEGKLEIVDLLSQPVTYHATANDVTFHLYTKYNVDDDEVVSVYNYTSSKYFNPEKQTIFVIHGWTDDYQSEMNVLIKNNLLNHYDVNVIVVDWSPLSKRNYITSKLSVLPVGKTVGKFIKDLAEYFLVDLERFALIGHSLGAHVAGNAGAALNGQASYIVGLDPAGPLFSLKSTKDRLDPTDARYVEVIHTSLLLGFGHDIGHSDFYPNGGQHQPGCGLDLANICAHSRSYQYYADSLKEKFLGHECSSYDDFEEGLCNYNEIAVMGEVHVDKKARGKYFLKTRSKQPYAMKVVY